MEKYRLLAYISSGLCLSGCMTSNGLQYQSVATTNLYHIARVQKGMSERRVLQIMHKPYSYESFQVDDDIYDVWFYVTKATGLDQTRMVPQNLTPLTFKNGVLVGTGYYWYYYAMKEQAGEVDLYTPPAPKPKTHTQEDVEFEKALRDATHQKKAPLKSPATLIPAGPNTPRPSERKKVPLEIPKPDHAPEQAPEVSCTPSCAPVKSPKNLVRGMSEEQAIELYGQPTCKDSFVLNKDLYELLYFDTVTSKTGSRSIIPQNQTAAVFRNGGFTTISEEQYYKLKKKSCTNCDEAVSVQEGSEPVGAAFAKYHSSYKIQVGMSETEVTNAIGAPENFKTFEFNEDVYDIWFYPKRPPLTFKNSVLVGTTTRYYNQLREETGQSVNGYDRDVEQMEEEDSDQNFNYW
jgi:outer membrane protein assembly factor BamE (lipoprotein component of BamABCDE complex)